MNNESNAFVNTCADLVTQKKTETFLLCLLKDRPKGAWVVVSDLCREAQIDANSEMPNLVVSWLDDPSGDPDYAVIVFYDTEALQSFAAHYNQRRLLEAYQA